MKNHRKEQLGDTHNFGKRVRPEGKHWIHKPRSTFWEEMVLSEKSKFRKLIEEILIDEPFIECTPKIKFKKKVGGVGTLVEKVVVRTLREDEFDLEYVFEAFGGLLAFCSILGVEDLHADNIFFGKDLKTEKIVLSSMDIEFIFNGVTLPTVIGLLPIERSQSPDIESGCSSIISLIRNASARDRMAILYGYIRVCDKMFENSKRLLDCIKMIPGVNRAPIRCAIRHTQDYLLLMGKRHSMKLINENLKVLEEEKVQMDRGDVPYFFSMLGDRRVRYFVSPDLKKSKCLEDQNYVSQISRATLNLEDVFSHELRKELLAGFGVVILAGYFLPSDFKGTLFYRKLRIQATQKSVKVQYGESEILEGDRDWTTLKLLASL